MAHITAFFRPPVPAGLPARAMAHNETFKDSKIRHLLAEIFQNSRDATMGAYGPQIRAKLLFRLYEVATDRLKAYGLDEVQEHVLACREATLMKTRFGRTVTVLGIEDQSGGLEGAPTATNNDILSGIGRFTFAVGVGDSLGGKKGRNNGRHGRGAGTMADASVAGLMYYHSCHATSGNYASGRNTLPTHTLDGLQYDADVRLGLIKEDGSWGGLLSGKDASRLYADLGFVRGENVPGLSCAVISPEADITYETIVYNVLAHQLWQIAMGYVDCTVRDDRSGKEITITAENVGDLLSGDSVKQIKDSLPKKRGRKAAHDPLDLSVGMLSLIRACDFNETHSMIDFDADVDPLMRQAWLSGKVVSGRILISADHVELGTIDGFLRVYGQKIGDTDPGFVLLVRDEIVNVVRVTGYRGVVISSGDAFAVALGDAEDASHTSWTAKQAATRGWIEMADSIRLFEGAVTRLRSHLVAVADVEDRISLAKYFPMPGKALPSRGPGGAEDENGVPGKKLVELVQRNGFVSLRISGRELEFSLTPEAKTYVAEHGPQCLSVSIEYRHKNGRDGSIADTDACIGDWKGFESFTEHEAGSWTLNGVTESTKFTVLNIDFNRDITLSNSLVEATETLGEAA